VINVPGKTSATEKEFVFKTGTTVGKGEGCTGVLTGVLIITGGSVGKRKDCIGPLVGLLIGTVTPEERIDTSTMS
jgi:hypothetical protein